MVGVYTILYPYAKCVISHDCSVGSVYVQWNLVWQARGSSQCAHWLLPTGYHSHRVTHGPGNFTFPFKLLKKKKKKKKKLHLSSREGMMRCPQNTQKPKLQRTTRGGQTKVKNKKEPAKRGRGEGKKKGGGRAATHVAAAKST
jgi:hypothetical protein